MINSILKIGVLIMFAFFILGMIGYALGWFAETGQVAKEEFGPRSSLEKYEWFKDASSQLEKKKEDINIYKQRITSFEADYEGVKRKDWDRIDKQTYSQYQQELAGVRSSYNKLAAEYNANSQKFNWNIYKGNSDIPPYEYKELK